MTDNQPTQPPPPGDRGEGYAAGPAGSPDAPPPAGWQGQPQQGQQFQGQQQGQPETWQGQQAYQGQPGAWQGQQAQTGGWQGQQAYQGQQGYQAQQASGDERTWMILAHLSAPIAFIFSAGVLSFLGPLLIWFLRKDDSPPVRQVAAAAFNFNLMFWLLYVLGWVVAVLTLGLGFLVVIPFWIAIFLVAAYMHIKGALRASRGEVYTYPFQLPVLS